MSDPRSVSVLSFDYCHVEGWPVQLRWVTRIGGDTMAKEDVARLFRAAQTNLTLRETLNSAPTPEAFVKMAQKFGYHFTVQEWAEMTTFRVEELEGQLSEIPGL